MTYKVKTDKIETIKDLKRKENGSVYEPETIKTPDYSYGINQEPLDAEFQIRNIKKQIIEMPESQQAPTDTTNKLYNIGGTLYFNGTAL